MRHQGAIYASRRSNTMQTRETKRKSLPNHTMVCLVTQPRKHIHGFAGWLQNSRIAPGIVPNYLSSTAPRMSNVAYWPPKKKQSLCHTYLLQKPALRVHWLVAKRPYSSKNHAQHAFPAQRPKCLTSRTDALKNKSYATPTPCRNQLWESIGWFRNGRTAAGIVPKMPSQRSAPNV